MELQNLTVELQTEEAHVLLLCLLSTSASQVWQINVPVLPVNELPAKFVMEHVAIIHQVIWQGSRFSVSVPETANLLVLKATSHVN